MEIKSIVCDRCGVTKKTDNHWFKIGLYKNTDKFYIIPYNNAAMDYVEWTYKDICGDDCLIKEVQDYSNNLRQVGIFKKEVDKKSQTPLTDLVNRLEKGRVKGSLFVCQCFCDCTEEVDQPGIKCNVCIADHSLDVKI